MEESIDLECKFRELNVAWCVDDVRLEYNTHILTCRFMMSETLYWNVHFKGLVDLHYAPDYMDDEPGSLVEAKLETLRHEDELDEGEGLWLHGNGAFIQDMPMYRVTFSGDTFLKIVCRAIEFVETGPA